MRVLSRIGKGLRPVRVLFIALTLAILATACQPSTEEPGGYSLRVDTLITNGQIFTGSDAPPMSGFVGITDDRIAFVSSSIDSRLEAARTIDAAGKLVIPGFIDPHTHSDAELRNPSTSQNLNYLTQGVTTVLIGNDGDGVHDIAAAAEHFQSIGIGSNVAFLVGHSAVRDHVMGKVDRPPTPTELSAMKGLVEMAMNAGALGLSSGLYYRPGSYANTDEVIELAGVAARHGGLYETHLRDESSYNIGLIAAVQEALDIGKQAGLPVHVAHIKALGVDVWGESASVIAMIEAAQQAGQQVTADQYPWRASGTHLDNALVARWAMAGSDEEFHARLRDPKLRERIVAEMHNNLRIRGGAESLLIADCPEPTYTGKTLADISSSEGRDPIDIALDLLVRGSTRVISFNMNPADIHAFMQKPWVMTSSDGNDGHPRKYASYPKKYRNYVIAEGLMSVSAFIHRSSGLVADTFGISNRGYLRAGYFADIAIIDPETFAPQADFDHWNRLSTGVDYLLVNGKLAIDGGYGTAALSGRTLKRED